MQCAEKTWATAFAGSYAEASCFQRGINHEMPFAPKTAFYRIPLTMMELRILDSLRFFWVPTDQFRRNYFDPMNSMSHWP